MDVNVKHMMDILPCGYLITTSQGRILFANKFILDLLGKTAADKMEDHDFAELLPAAVLRQFETEIWPLLKINTVVNEIAIELIREDSIQIPVLMNIASVVKGLSYVDAIQYTFFDNSMQKQYELEVIRFHQKQEQLIHDLTLINSNYSDLAVEMQKDNTYFKNIVSSNSFFIIKTDLLGGYTYLNPMFCEIFGIKAENWIGRNSLQEIIPEDHEACEKVVESCFKEPEKSHWVILRKNSLRGRIVNHWEFKLLNDDAGNPFEFLCVGHEVTPLIQKQQELEALANITEEQNKRLINFTYIVSHNVRSHVANLKGVIDVFDFEDPEDRGVAVNLMRESVYKLDDTIHNLNEITAIQSTIHVPQSDIVLITKIKEVLQSIQMLIVNSGTTISYDFGTEQHLTTNSAYFESIVLNLVTNAIRYKSLNRNPVITFRVERIKNYKVLAVIDNGLGIDLIKYKDKLFGMYNTFHGNEDATGLGLFITKTQIEALKGRIIVESEVGLGSTFRVYFPKSSLPEADQAAGSIDVAEKVSP